MTLPVVYALNNYLWKVLQVRAGWNSSDYGGKIPITEASEPVEFDEFNKPFIVYGWALEGVPGDIDVLNVENVGYNIYSNSTTLISNVSQLINLTFRMKEWSASNINKWLLSDQNSLKNTWAGINFTSTDVVSISGPVPPTTEDGRTSGFVVVRYAYTLANDPATYRFG